MDISQIRKLIGLVRNTDITELEVTIADQTVRISRQNQAAATQAPAAAQQVYAAAAPAATPAPAAAEAPAAASEPDDAHVVKSPMVGTYYSAPSPDADAFISVGAKVAKGDTLCIIEAMKMMNEIEAEYGGIVEAILVDNASPLEYGQPMFIITPLA
ncbi:acetyl-CoA carboxylase biotin carboxyl carrier protein [Mariprofundus ferrooxydans]|uniref:acetyl-CoA carboxylase biotin carboxyl carrier protein n=1 Tax=Mariprofundus ferrooxydans TaxID=314344 RepID=UPI000382339D|nr:acetyl-CoA carboxylase biotin carboxyl carrier protein [Mariprofundus ferrooxydans]